jgi:hypothetical protein
LPQESNNFPRFVAVVAIPRRQSVSELCLQVLLGNSVLKAQKGKSMQNGSMMRTERYGGPDVKPPDLTELHVPFCAYKKSSGCPKTLTIRQTGPEIGDGVVPFCACAKSGRSP